VLARIVTLFGEEMDVLQAEVARMGGLAEWALRSSIETVTQRDLALAAQVIMRDAEIDRAQFDLENRVVRVLALRQPLAHDLRSAIASLKIATDLERIGDLAKNIAKRAKPLAVTEAVEPVRSVARIGALVTAQLQQVLDAYSQSDALAAARVWARDDEIDEHYNSLFLELVSYMSQDPRMVGVGTHMMFVAKNLERIGDHATNIAEVVHFLVTGEELRFERPKSDVTSSSNVIPSSGLTRSGQA
jgi:phosphate transport system protein